MCDEQLMSLGGECAPSDGTNSYGTQQPRRTHNEHDKARKIFDGCMRSGRAHCFRRTNELKGKFATMISRDCQLQVVTVYASR